MFYLAPHPKLDRPRRGSPLMFTIPWVEKYLSRVRPWHVIAIWVPFTVYLLYRSSASFAVPAIAGWAALGVLSWTLLEYLLHRWVFHFEPNPASELQRDASFLIHGIHHDYPWDRDRLVMPPTVTAVIALVVWFGFRWMGPVEPPWFAGMVAGYVWYDLTHYYLHHAAPTTAAGKWLRRYHLVHHFQTPDRRYGITTPLWDFVFGTYPHDRYQGLPDDEARLEAGA
jgi:dihydroceramide fatty acyl 2-hydroxylase